MARRPFYYRETNGSVQLMTRRWLIHDSIGKDTEVEGDGVVGQQPMLPPGRVHEYQSSCILESPSGYMEGHYHFVCEDESGFDAQIPRFPLNAPATADPLT